jgi:hypothetical protein
MLCDIGNGAMTLHNIGNGAMNPPQYWQQRYEPCTIVPVALLGQMRLFKENRETQFSL